MNNISLRKKFKLHGDTFFENGSPNSNYSILRKYLKRSVFDFVDESYVKKYLKNVYFKIVKTISDFEVTIGIFYDINSGEIISFSTITHDEDYTLSSDKKILISKNLLMKRFVENYLVKKLLKLNNSSYDFSCCKNRYINKLRNCGYSIRNRICSI